MSRAAYLAKNYLTASTASSNDQSDTRPTKKRRKNKHGEGTTSLVIADDDDDLLLSSKSRTIAEDDDLDRPMFDTNIRSAEFRKSKKNAWKTVPKEEPPGQDQQNEAHENEGDTILRETIANDSLRRANLDAENAPTIVDEPKAPQMETGVRAGLQTAADTARMVAEQEARNEAEAQALRKASKKSKTKDVQPEEETIYRDATGRRIDLSMRRAEVQKAQREKEAAEKRAREDAMGEVQLRQRAERKQELEDAKFLTLGRGADDEEMNDRLKEQVRWDDPMAAYMASKQQDENGLSVTKSKSGGGISSSVVKARRKEYTGAAPPNRYGIKPGWRWDGVDRGNGFEKEWFQARGRKSRVENLEYMWQMDE